MNINTLTRLFDEILNQKPILDEQMFQDDRFIFFHLNPLPKIKNVFSNSAQKLRYKEIPQLLFENGFCLPFSPSFLSSFIDDLSVFKQFSLKEQQYAVIFVQYSFISWYMCFFKIQDVNITLSLLKYLLQLSRYTHNELLIKSFIVVSHYSLIDFPDQVSLLFHGYFKLFKIFIQSLHPISDDVSTLFTDLISIYMNEKYTLIFEQYFLRDFLRYYSYLIYRKSPLITSKNCDLLILSLQKKIQSLDCDILSNLFYILPQAQNDYNYLFQNISK